MVRDLVSKNVIFQALTLEDCKSALHMVSVRMSGVLGSQSQNMTVGLLDFNVDFSTMYIEFDIMLHYSSERLYMDLQERGLLMMVMLD